MPRRTADDWEDEDDDRWQADEDDDPPEEDVDPDDGEPLVECRYCHREILEDSPYCPYCENYISEEDAPPARRPWWFIAGVILCLLIIYTWIMSS